VGGGWLGGFGAAAGCHKCIIHVLRSLSRKSQGIVCGNPKERGQVAEGFKKYSIEMAGLPARNPFPLRQDPDPQP